MSANLAQLFRRRRPQRYEWDEAMPSGVLVSDIGLPEMLQGPAASPVIPQRIYTPPDWSANPTSAPVAAVPDAVAIRPRRVFTAPDWNAEPQPPPDAQERERIADPRAFMTNRINDIVAHPTQTNTNSRLGGGLRAGRRVGLRVLRETGNPFAALGATLSGFGYGLANKEYDEQLAEEDSAGRMQGRLAQMDAREKSALERAGTVADITLKQANAAKALREPAIKPDYQLKDADDGTYAVNMADPSAPPIKLPFALKSAADNYDIYDDGSKVWAVNKRNPKDRYELEGVSSKPKPQMVDVKLPNGQVVQVPAATAVTAAATAGRSGADAQTQQAWRQYEISKAQTDKENALTQKRYEDAREAVDALSKALEKAREKAEESNNPPPGKDGKPLSDADRAFYRKEFERAQQRVRELAARVRQIDPNGELVRDDPEERWPVILGPRPEPKAYSPPPAVSLAPGPEVVGPTSSGGGDKKAVGGATPARVQSVIERIRKRR